MQHMLDDAVGDLKIEDVKRTTMTETMLKFVSRDREAPPKRAADERREDFAEIYRQFAADHASTQASRCSQCGVPFCANHCPLGNDIPDWLRLVAGGEFEEAYHVSCATNNMPEICGRICPQDRLCEGACVIEQSGHGTVTIGAVESFITEMAFEKGWVSPATPVTERRESVGIIGAGPAGLAAAEELRKAGIQVTIYDRYDRAGGLLIYGIPNFKLDKKVVNRRVKHLEASGITFKLNVEIGRQVSLADLRAKHTAIIIATGVYRARNLDCPIATTTKPVPALDYLTISNKAGLGDSSALADNGVFDAAGKRVVVIGGGDTAMDCVRTAIRQGADAVSCLYRRDRANMPGSQREVAHAEEEGVVFEWLAAPKSIDGRVRAARMKLGAPDGSGRHAPTEIEGADFSIDADMVITALGFVPENLPLMFDEPGLKVTERGTLGVNRKTLETSLPGIYAAGDIVRGASLVVWGIHDGRLAAASIINALRAEQADAVLDRAAG